MNKLVVFGVLAFGLMAGAVLSVKLGPYDGDEPKEAFVGSVGGLTVAGAGLLGCYHRMKKGKDRAVLPVS